MTRKSDIARADSDSVNKFNSYFGHFIVKVQKVILTSTSASNGRSLFFCKGAHWS